MNVIVPAIKKCISSDIGYIIIIVDKLYINIVSILLSVLPIFSFFFLFWSTIVNTAIANNINGIILDNICISFLSLFINCAYGILLENVLIPNTA